ncbi:hypothetical protein AB0M28_17100 [Streptomyces sp. NPDC051940]|uniref:hypothetical protein n=1 Tax=Streptomyces sp. NPDC051940 TaxID=3155675 RepID=UPI0034378EEE
MTPRRELPVAVREMRADAALLGCLALLIALLTTAVTAAPPLLDRMEGRALDQRLATGQRDDALVRISAGFDQLSDASPPVDMLPTDGPAPLGEDLEWAVHGIEPELVGDLRGSLSFTSTRVDVPSSAVDVPGGPAELSLLYADDAPDAYVSGRAPRGTGRDKPVEVAVSEATAERLGLRVGQQVQLMGGLSDIQAPAVVSGVFRGPKPGAAGARIWREQPLLARPQAVPGTPVHAQALIAAESLDPLQRYGLPRFQAQWRMRLGLADAADTFAGEGGRAELVRALAEYEQLVKGSFCNGCSTLKPTGWQVTDGARPVVESFGGEWRRAELLASFALASLVGTGLAAVVVLGRLAVRRREGQHRLQRARGASALGVAASRALQTAPAALLGLAAGLTFASGGSPWTALAVAGGAWLALPALTWLALRDRTLRAASEAPAHRRTIAEATVVLLAAAGIGALRLRGTGSGSGLDLQLAAVPVLTALAVVVLLVRVYPLPLRALARLCARRRGALPLIGFARAAKDAPAATLALVVLVTMLGSAVFGGLVDSTVRAGRATAVAWATGGADAALVGATDPTGTGAVRRAPGVVRTADVHLLRTDLTSTRSGAARTAAYVVAPDGARLRGPAAAAVRTLPKSADGTVIPVLATDGVVGAGTGDTFETTLKGARVRVRVAGVLPRSVLRDPALGPLLGRVTDLDASPVLLADASALTAAEQAGAHVAADHLTLLYGGPKGLDPAAVRAAAPPSSPGSAYGTLVFRSEEAGRDGGEGVLDIVRRVHAACTAVAAAFALLALLLELLLSAPERGRTASYLRTLGLGARPGALLGLLQLAPMALAAAVGGVALGYALPAALGPALELRALTGGPVEPPLHTDYVLTAALGLGTLALIACAVAVDHVAGRRRGVGSVLRLGDPV